MDKLKNFVTHPSTVLVSYIFTTLGFFLSLSNNIVLQIIAMSIMTVCFIISIFYLVKFRLNIKKEKRKLKETLETTYLDNTNQILCEASNLVRSIVDNSLNEKNDSIADQHFRSICENVCNSIGDLLLGICNIEFSVCLKQICVDKLITYDYEDAYTQTIARTGAKSVERARNDFARQPIADNTSFLTILQTNDRCWASPNLDKTKEILKKANSQYKNPDRDYKKYYCSTIVAPVRINSRFMSNTILQYAQTERPDRFHYMAFLCIDSPQKFSSKNKNFNLASLTLSICGDALYPLFENKLTKEIDMVQ